MKNFFIRHFFIKQKKEAFGSPSRISRMYDTGENMQDAYEMAWDALGLAVVSRIENRESLPPATEPYAITAVSDTFCIIVPFDLIAYQKKA